MAITNHERVGKAMDLLKTGLTPFVEREFKNLYRAGACRSTTLQGEDRLLANKQFTAWDVRVAQAHVGCLE